MSTQRLVDSCFWDDSYIVTLDPCEKLLFLYLLTNPLTNIAGVYEVSMKRIAFDTGFEQDTVKRILTRFERDGRCIYRDGWIAMRNWLKHQRVNPSVEKGIERSLAGVPKALAGYVKGQSVTDCIQDALPNLTKLNLTQLNGVSTDCHNGAGLHKAVQDAFVAKHGEFSDYAKEGMSIKRLIAKAEKAFPTDPSAFLRELLAAFWALKQSGDKFWSSQPFLPSALNASGIYDRVCEKLRASAPVDAETAEAMKGVFK